MYEQQQLVVGQATTTTPSSRLPDKGTLDYAKVALELLLLLLAVPYLLRQLFRDPSGLSRKAARQHLKG